MSYSKIRPRGDLKANWESANPILSAREIGVEWETKIGVGDAKIKFGDGVTAWKNLDYAVVNNITKKIITTFATVSDADPALNAGESLDTILGKIKKKFQYLADNKLNKSAKYDGVDSTSTDLYATANAVRKVNVKADKNASDITTLNNNLSNKFKITADNGYTQLSQLMDVGAWSEPFVFDIPYTSSLAPASNNAVGIAERGMLHAFDYAGKHFYCIDASKGWQKSPYALKSDLLNLSRTFVSGDSFSDAKDLSIPPGIYGVNPGLKNIPENTYGLLEVTADTVNNWRFLKFTPTNIKSHYLMFYNGYDKTWSEWAHFASTT